MTEERIEQSAEEEAAAEELRRLRRRQRIERMQREKKRAQMRQRCVIPVAVLVVLLGACIGVNVSHTHSSASPGQEESRSSPMPGESVSEDNREESNAQESSARESNSQESGKQEESPRNASAPDEEKELVVLGPYLSDIPKKPVFSATADAATEGFGAEIVSGYGVLIDVAQGRIVARKDAGTKMNPASMTKILTVLTAADELGLTGENWETATVLEDTFTITIEITDYSYVHDCSNVGFEVGEEVTVRDLFYGTVLPSGGDAALGLAYYVAGSQEAFVELMNEKLEELNLSDTSHFTNCVGLYDEEHYSTVYDMAVMLKTAADSGFCRQVLSAHTYTTTPTAEHPDGLLISNWFLRRIEDKDTHGEVICGKTGFVNQSGSCAASLAADGSGKEYLCVTAGAGSSWQCIYDQVALYQKYLQKDTE